MTALKAKSGEAQQACRTQAHRRVIVYDARTPAAPL
jgi:hypothetical protein